MTYDVLKQDNVLRVMANIRGNQYAERLEQYQFMSLVSFIIAMVVWLMLVCALVNQNMGVLKKPFYLEYIKQGSRRASCSSICIIIGVVLTIFSIVYAVCISN